MSQEVVAETQDPVTLEPDARTPADVMPDSRSEVLDKKIEKSIENTDNSSQNDNDGLSSDEQDQRPLDPREEIARRYEERNYGNSEQTEPEPEPEATVEETPQPLSDKVEVKVNGRVLQVDRAKVEAAGGVELYQKTVAVNEGFKQVASERKSIEAERAALESEKRRLYELQNQTQPPPQQGADAQASQDLPGNGDQRQVNRADLIKQYREALLDGDDATADKLMLQLLDNTAQTTATLLPPQPEIDESAVAQTAVKLLKQEQYEVDMVTAGQQILESNPELLTDPILFNAVDSETNVVLQEHPDWTPAQVMNEAVTRVNNWRDGKTPQPTKETTQTERVAEKRALNTPRANTGRSTPPPAPKAQSNSDYIRQLRKQRGLPE